MSRDDDRETWTEAHGYARVSCSRCGWSGMTDTGQCDRCPSPCDECGAERSEGEGFGDWCYDCSTRCESCGEAMLRKDDRDGWCPACGEREDRGCAAECTAGDEEEHDAFVLAYAESLEARDE